MANTSLANSPPRWIGTKPVLGAFAANIVALGNRRALEKLASDLDQAPAGAWIICASSVVAAVESADARHWLERASARWPFATELRHQLAQVLWRENEVAAAEKLVTGILAAEPDYKEAVRLNALILRAHGKVNAAAASIAEWCVRQSDGVETTLACAQFVADCQRHDLALKLCNSKIASAQYDGRLLAMSANLALQLGQFDLARQRALDAMNLKVSLNEWFVARTLALSQRYNDGAHSDFGLFGQLLNDSTLTEAARAAILFARAKASDDVGDYAGATRDLRQAHATAPRSVQWNSAGWALWVERRVSAKVPGIALADSYDTVPVFIVGLPRTGTTLVAELLSRNGQVRNRGEVSFLPFIDRALSESGKSAEVPALVEAKQLYLTHMQQDDSRTKYYIDKNPLNFRYLGLVAALFPQAKVIHCTRGRRDTALSIWSQFFAHADYGFAHKFEDISAFANGHDQLMQHWRQTLPLAIFPLEYTRLVQQPEETMKEIRAFLEVDDDEKHSDSEYGIGHPNIVASASVWQARQPIYSRSVARWKHYSPHIPELTSLFDE